MSKDKMQIRLIFSYAAALLLIAFVGGWPSGGQHAAVFTPVFFAGLLVLLGLLAFNKDFRLFGLHGATISGLLAFINGVASWRDLWRWSTLSAGEQIVTAVYSLLALLSLVFIGLMVRAFITARRAADEAG